MIKFSDNCEEIAALWQQAFGDSYHEIMFFIANVKNARCLMAYEGEKPVSMMYLVPCRINGEAYSYIYAACTLQAYEGKGYMTRLLAYCREQNWNVCLIPASDTLVDFYKKRGLEIPVPIEDLEFEQTDEIMEYLLEGYELSSPAALRSEVKK